MNSVQNEVGLDASSSLATTSRYVITKDESQQNTLNRQRVSVNTPNGYFPFLFVCMFLGPNC